MKLKIKLRIKKDTRRKIYMNIAIFAMLLNSFYPYFASYRYVYAEDLGDESAVETQETSAEDPEGDSEEGTTEGSEENEEVAEEGSEGDSDENTPGEPEEASEPETSEGDSPEDGEETLPEETQQGDILPDGVSDYRPEEPVEAEPSLTDSTDSADPIVGSIENTVEEDDGDDEIVKVCLGDNEEITDSAISDWEVDSEKGYAETKEKVKLGVKYIFPEDEKVTLTFTCLPENDDDRSILRIQKVLVDDLNLPEEFSTDAEYAYDITTDMDDGDFEYDLTLPKPEGVEAGVVYIEKEVGDEISGEDVEEIDSENVKQNKGDSEVTLENIQHFTIFVIIGSAGAATEDPLATSGTDYLRYVGNPAPTDTYSHAYQWADPYYRCDPNNKEVVFKGKIDVSDMSTGDVAFVGLIDEGLLSSGATGYQSGAYVYIYKKTATTMRIGPTDGNLGGEIVQVAGTFDIGDSNKFDLEVRIYEGNISVKVDDNSPIIDTYGEVKTLNNVDAYDWDEFENGAIPGWDFTGSSEMPYEFEISGCSIITTPNKVTICHATNSDANPYIVNTPARSGDLKGHADHLGGIYPEDDWGDIIPEFTYLACPEDLAAYTSDDPTECHKQVEKPGGGKTKKYADKVEITFPGLNWDSPAGQAIYNNDCKIPPLNVCGNGILESEEQCDDGNNVDGDGCSANCTTEVPQCVDGEAWAAKVTGVTTGTLYGGGTITDPIRTDTSKALGENDGNFYSLGLGGELILEFSHYVKNIPGDDISVHEITWNRTDDKEEKAQIYVSTDGSDWLYLGEASSFTDSDSDGTRDGITFFDLDDIASKPSWVRYIKLVESSTGQYSYDDGFDLDAVGGIDGVCEEPEEPIELCGDGIKTENEQCDGEDGVVEKGYFCTPTCKLVPVYDGKHTCTPGTTPVKVGTYDISSTDSEGKSFSVVSGTEYLFKVIGTYNYDKNNRGKYADAAYATDSNWHPPYRSDIGIWGTNRGVTSVLGDLGNGIGVIEWDNNKNVNSSHVYSKAYKPTTDEATFLISDWYSDWYNTNLSCNEQGCMGDNEGSLTLEVYECQSLSTVQACKEDTEGKKLGGWDVVLVSESDRVSGPTEINVKDDEGTDSESLPAGKYLIRVSGTYRFANWGSYGIADAEWSYRTAAYTPDNIAGWVKGEGYFASECGLDARVNGTCVDWGSLKDSHNYTYVFDHPGGAVNVSIWDNVYGDNANDGKFSFEIFRINKDLYGTTRYVNGCKTFTNVPHGNYILDEVLKTDWVDDSGKGDVVTVDQKNETFTLVNKYDVPMKIIATKIVCDHESYLPNWGAEGTSDGEPTKITENTAQNWIEKSEGHCKLASDWGFQWGDDDVTNPGDEVIGKATGWNDFDSVTGADGRALATIDYFGKTDHIKVREVLQEGYVPFTYTVNGNNKNNESAEIYCDTDILNYDNDDRIVKPEYGKTYHCVAFNAQSVIPTVNVAKWNETLGAPQSIGSIIRYHIKVWVEGTEVKNVKLTDLLPKGFDFIEGSWEARDYENNLIAMSAPTYASPGEWDLGTLVPEKPITLSYSAEILDGVSAGEHKDIAWAVGTDLGGGRILGLADEEGYVATNFVGTAVNLDVEVPPSKAKAEVDEEEREEEVLGASTTELPATGASTVVTLVALVGLVIGATLTVLSKKKKIGSMVLTALLFTMLSSSKVFAAGDVVVLLQEPVSLINQPLNLSFVVMDTSETPVELTAQCYKDGPDSGWIPFGSPITIDAGGNTDVCDVNSSVLSAEGYYEFKVEVDGVVSNIVSTTYDKTGPDKPKYIEVDRKSSCKYEVEFKTANDGQTSYVEVYMKDDKEYTANADTRIRTISIGPDTKHEFDIEASGEDCAHRQYFAVRAFDAAGNASKVEAEELVKVITIEVEGEGSETQEALLVAGGGSSVSGEGFEGAEVITSEEEMTGEDEEGSILGEYTENEEEKGTAGGLFSSPWTWVALIALVGGVAINGIRKAKK